MIIGISSYPTFGGSGVVASELGMALAEKGHDVHFITYAPPNRLDISKPRIHYHEVTVPEYPLFEYAPYALALASKIYECAKKYKIDIIHAHYVIPHTVSALLARSMYNNKRFKVVTTLHGTDITLVGRDKSFLPIIKFSIEKSDQVSCVSKFLCQETKRVFRCEKEIKQIYNFINPAEFTDIYDPGLKQQFAPNGEKLLVHISNFRPIKRARDVFIVFKNLRKSLNVKLVLVGEGPELDMVKRLAKQTHLSGDVIYCDVQIDVKKILSVSDVLLLPSENESFGLVALESMAAGTPPITSDVGGLPEVVKDRQTGKICKLGDTDQMTQAALELLTNKDKYDRMSRAARKWAFEKFNINDIILEYEKLYENALQ